MSADPPLESLAPEIVAPEIVAYVDHVDGEIRGFGSYTPDQPTPPLAAGRAREAISGPGLAMLQNGPDACYVAEGELRARILPPIACSTFVIAANGADAAVLSGIPSGAMLRVSGAASIPWTEVTDGTVTLTTSAPGRLVVEIRCPPPHAQWLGMIHAL